MTDTFKGYTKEQVDGRMEEALVAWAGAKWPELDHANKVEFDVGYDAGWSEYTPGDGAYTDVTITRRQWCQDCGQYREHKTVKRLDYDADLINELLFFMFVGELPS